MRKRKGRGAISLAKSVIVPVLLFWSVHPGAAAIGTKLTLGGRNTPVNTGT